MKKVIYITSIFLAISFIAAVYVDAADYSSRSLYINNASIPGGNGMTFGSLEKKQKGSQYIISKVNKSFSAYIKGYDPNGSGPQEHPVKYTIFANQQGPIENISSEINYGYGLGDTYLRLVSNAWFGMSSTFQGMWIPDAEFYQFVQSQGGI